MAIAHICDGIRQQWASPQGLEHEKPILMNLVSIALHSKIRMFHNHSNVSLLDGGTSDRNRAFEFLDRYSVLRLSMSRRDISQTFCAGLWLPKSLCRPDLEFSSRWLRFVSCLTYFIVHQIERRRFYLRNINKMDVNRFYAQTKSFVTTRFEHKYRQNICNPESSGSFSASRPILKDFDDPSIENPVSCF